MVQSAQFLKPLVYLKLPQHLSFNMYRGQKQNKQLKSASFSILWQGKYSHFVF